MPKKCCFSCFSLKSANRSGAFFDFCVHIHKIVQSFNRSVVQSFNRSIVQSFSRSIQKSFSRSVVQSFNHIYIYIVEMGYFAVHGTWRHMVLGSARHCVAQGTAWRMVGNFSLYFFMPGAKTVRKYK